MEEGAGEVLQRRYDSRVKPQDPCLPWTMSVTWYNEVQHGA